MRNAARPAGDHEAVAAHGMIVGTVRLAVGAFFLVHRSAAPWIGGLRC